MYNKIVYNDSYGSDKTMEEFNFDNVGKWLNTTEQQFHIIKALYKLESKTAETMPKDIGREYTRLYGKIIQKPNLFTILRALMDKNLIQKDSRSNYRIRFDGLRQALGKHREQIEREGEEFRNAYSKTEDYFRRNMPRSDRPMVDYYEHKDLYTEMVKSIKNSGTVNTVSNFPSIAYTYNIASATDRLGYIQTLWDLCFREKKLEVNYLTTLDMDYLFNQAMRSLEEPKQAFKECEIVLKQLSNQLEAQKRLHIKVVEEQKGMDYCIPAKERPMEFYLFIKDEHKETLGGIRIKSPETASQAEDMFKSGFNYAEDLNEKTIQKASRKLKHEYGTLR